MFVLFKGEAVRKNSLFFSSQIFIASAFAVDNLRWGEGEAHHLCGNIPTAGGQGRGLGGEGGGGESQDRQPAES